MSDMTLPPMQRDNPYTKALNAIAAQNARAGYARSSTVLPPPPPAPSAEDMEEARRIEEELWGDTGPTPTSTQRHSPAVQAPVSAPSHASLTRFTGIDLDTRLVLGNNGEVFAFNEEEAKGIIAWAFNVAQRGIALQLRGVAENMGLEIAGGPENGGSATQKVPQMPENQAPPAVPNRQKAPRRKA